MDDAVIPTLTCAAIRKHCLLKSPEFMTGNLFVAFSLTTDARLDTVISNMMMMNTSIYPLS